MSRYVVPLLLLVSGVALAGAGLVAVAVMKEATPLFAFAVLAAGVLDGVTGIAWTAARVLWGKPAPREAAGPAGASIEAERERDRQRLMLLATGSLAILFLCILAAVAFYMPLIIRWIRASGLW